jgi:hypothetical protein
VNDEVADHSQEFVFRGEAGDGLLGWTEEQASGVVMRDHHLAV